MMLPGSKGIVVSLRLAAALLGFSAAAWAGQEGEVNSPSQEPQPAFHLRTGDLPEGALVEPQSIPVPDRSQTLLREPPTIHGELHFGEQTLIPYLGAGFGGGYVTEQDRMLGPDPTLQNKNILGDGSGKGYMPNEFQMGIRIPF
jgi:hypothetical protein